MLEKILGFIFDLTTSVGLKLLYAILILVVGLLLAKWLVKALRKSKAITHLDESFAKFLCNILQVALNATVIIAAAITIGIPATSFITILGSAGLAIGLALQGSLSNFAGSLMIMLFKPYKIGDYIKSGEIEGVVADINVFYTIVDTADNKRISCPNGSLSNSNIANYSSEELRRVDLTFKTANDTDVETVKKILLDTVGKTAKVLTSPAPVARLSNHGDGPLEFALRVWCKSSDYWDVYFDLVEGVKAEFDKNGITIPCPKMNVIVNK